MVYLADIDSFHRCIGEADETRSKHLRKVKFFFEALFFLVSETNCLFMDNFSNQHSLFSLYVQGIPKSFSLFERKCLLPGIDGDSFQSTFCKAVINMSEDSYDYLFKSTWATQHAGREDKKERRKAVRGDCF